MRFSRPALGDEARGVDEISWVPMNLPSIQRDDCVRWDLNPVDIQPLHRRHSLRREGYRIVETQPFVDDALEYRLWCSATVRSFRESRFCLLTKLSLVLGMSGEENEEGCESGCCCVAGVLSAM